MRKPIRFIAITVLVGMMLFILSGCADNQSTVEKVTLRNGIIINDSMDTVREKEKAEMTEDTRVDDGLPMLQEKGLVIYGLNDTSLNCYFDKEGKLYELSYAFSTEGDATGDYTKIENDLQASYGDKRSEALGFLNVKGQGERGYEFACATEYPGINIVTSLEDYSERIISGEPYDLKIEHIIYRIEMLSTSRYVHLLSYVRIDK